MSMLDKQDSVRVCLRTNSRLAPFVQNVMGRLKRLN